MKSTNGHTENHSFSIGKNSKNYRAEASAILFAAKTLNQPEHISDSTVILIDYKSVLKSLMSSEENQILRDTNLQQKLL